MRTLLLHLASGLLLATSVHSQVGSFQAAGTELGQLLSQRERLDQAMRGARWNFGALALDPVLSIGNLAYRDNVFGEADSGTEDITATARAGLTGFLAVREDVTLTFHARPSYTWWEDLEDRRRINHDLGVGLFGTWNRLALGLEARRFETLGLVTEQTSQEINSRSDSARLGIELDLYRSLRLLLNANVGETEHLLDDEERDRLGLFRQLDRTTTTLSAGLGFDLGRLWTVELLVLEQETESADTAITDLSSEGTGYRSRWRLAGNLLSADLTVTHWETEPQGSSLAPEFEGWTWDGIVRLGTPDGRNLFDLYTRSSLQLALGAQFADFESRRYGLAYHRPLTENLSSSLFVETGELTFRRLVDGEDSGTGSDRHSYGARAHFQFRKLGVLSAEWARVEIESGGFLESSETNRFGLGFSIGLGSLTWP